MGLGDADNPILDAGLTMIIEPLLLPVDFMDDQQILVMTTFENRKRRLDGKLFNRLQVALEIPQLLSQGLAHLFL